MELNKKYNLRFKDDFLVLVGLIIFQNKVSGQKENSFLLFKNLPQKKI